MNCDRCGNEAAMAYRTSWFNTDTICVGPGSCSERECRHPSIKDAIAADEAAIRAGNYNFPGIGLPAELQPTDLRP